MCENFDAKSVVNVSPELAHFRKKRIHVKTLAREKEREGERGTKSLDCYFVRSASEKRKKERKGEECSF